MNGTSAFCAVMAIASELSVLTAGVRRVAWPYEGQQPLPLTDSEKTDDAVDDLSEDKRTAEEDGPVGDDPASEAEASDDPWENRTLCIDESCIGVIGPDGRCKECGKPYPG